MRNLVREIAKIIYNKFNFFWVILTILLLILSLTINWYLSINRSYENLNDIAVTISNNVDGFIDDLFQDVYTLPVYNDEMTDCKTGLYPFMEHISLNNPMISGLVISNKGHKLVCSTLPDNQTLISGNMHAKTMSGPFKLPLFDQPVFLIQQKIGNYYIGIIVVSSVLQSELRTSLSAADSVALHNQYDKKNIIRIEHSAKKPGWILSGDADFMSPMHAPFLFAMDPLQSIDGVEVVVFENHTTQIRTLWYSQIVLSILLLVGSYFLYYLIKNLLTERYSLHNAMKLALKKNEFHPLYQPLFDTHSKRFTGVEVLLRWQDNQDEIIMPDFFIEEAETTGVIVPITLQIIEKSFSDFKAILKENAQFHLGFNLSALHFKNPDFFDNYYRMAEKYKIDPKQIIFEITERDLLDKHDAIFLSKMQELRAKGYSLAVDDYGTGHASISYLQNFPFNFLKIDKQFVQAIGTKAITESLNDAIITMAKQLDLIIIAEGVETREQSQYLSENGVRFLQGWYYSKALAIEDIIDLLKRKIHDSIN